MYSQSTQTDKCIYSIRATRDCNCPIRMFSYSIRALQSMQLANAVLQYQNAEISVF